MRWTLGWVGVAAMLALTGCGADSAGPEGDVSLPTAEATVTAAQGEVTTLPPTSTSEGRTPTTDSSIETTVADGVFDACAALATVDLDALLGEPAGLPESKPNESGGGCMVPSLGLESSGRITFDVSSNAPAANYENSQRLFGVDAEIEGLGDAAFASGATLVVLADNTLVSLGVVRWRELGIGGATQPELEVAMREALAALGSMMAPVDDAAAVEGLACSWLAAVDIEGLVGEPMGAPTIEQDGAGAECEVSPIDPASTAYVGLTVSTSVFSEAIEQFAGVKEIFGVDSTVDGLGDEAFHSGPVLAVLSGERTFVLWIMGDIMLGADVDDAELEAAMAQVLAAAGE